MCLMVNAFVARVAARRCALLAVALCLAACSRAAGPLSVTLTSDQSATAAVRISGLSSRETDALRAAAFDEYHWRAFVRVTVDGQDAIPVAGKYLVVGDAVEFQPQFPFDPGRKYRVRVDPARLPSPRTDATTEVVVSLSPRIDAPSTFVSMIHPAGDALPENLLRIYVQFSAPMAEGATVGKVRLLDETGHEIPDVFLPFETGLWSSDHTRYTVFLAPGRVKEGILPNRQMGRALTAGKHYAFDVSADWRDANGQPLKSGYRREFRAGPAIEAAIDPKTWQLWPSAAGTREPLSVTFPSPLDHALALRALSVSTAAGEPVAGEPGIDATDTKWTFTPAQPWRAGAYALTALTILEDPSGNQIGRAFEVLRPTPAPATTVDRVTLPFSVK